MTERDIDAIIAGSMRLNPFDPAVVPHLLKVEYPGVMICAALPSRLSATCCTDGAPANALRSLKPRRAPWARSSVVRAKETTPKLARRIWLSILFGPFDVNPEQRHRAKPLVDFDVPLRRKFPISAPAILSRLDPHNDRDRTITALNPTASSIDCARRYRSQRAAADRPLRKGLAKSKRLQWVITDTGDPIRLDWNGNSFAGTVSVKRLDEFLRDYARHPEAKAADAKGNPAGPDTVGLLYRLPLQSKRLVRIGKEVDRLAGDEGATLTPGQPVEYEYDDLAEDIAYLAAFSLKYTALDIGVSARRWADIVKNVAKPRTRVAESIATSRHCISLGRQDQRIHDGSGTGRQAFATPKGRESATNNRNLVPSAREKAVALAALRKLLSNTKMRLASIRG